MNPTPPAETAREIARRILSAVDRAWSGGPAINGPTLTERALAEIEPIVAAAQSTARAEGAAEIRAYLDSRR